MNTNAAEHTPPGLRIWFGIIGAPAAFSIEELLGWLLSSGTCPRGSPEGYGGFPVLANSRPILLVIAAVALLVSLGALVVGVTEWRRSRDPGITSIRGTLRPDFLAAAAMLVSFVFTLGVLWMSVPVFWLPQCEVVR